MKKKKEKKKPKILINSGMKKKKKKEKDTYNDVIKARTRKNIDFYIFRHRDLLNNFK